MLEKIKKFYADHENRIKTIAGFATLIGGAVLLYKRLDSGYNCRVDLEKAAGNGLFEAIEKLAWEEEF